MVCAGKRILSGLLAVVILIYIGGCAVAGRVTPRDDVFVADSVKVFNGGRVFFVSPGGSDKNSGLSSSSPFKHIQKAIDEAYPGDTIVVMPGSYYENLHSVRSGYSGKPITIVGLPGSVIYGYRFPGKRVIDITHSYIHLLHLVINGNYKKGCTALNCYHDKLIYIHGSYKMLLRGIVVSGCELANAWGECLRLKYSSESRIGWNRISHCGIRDFVYKRGKQNGEGIYIGTAPEQSRGEPDATHDIYVYDNVIATYGAECVDVKENSSRVFIYNNVCTEEKAAHVGGISVRNNNSLIQGNIVFGNRGAGIRLGGDTKSYGINNSVIGNYMDNNGVAGLKVMVFPQKKMCANRTSNEKRYYTKGKKNLKGAFEPCVR